MARTVGDEAGLALTAATISWTAGAWIQARGATRWPTHQFVRLGFAVTTAGLAGMLLVLDLDVPLADRDRRVRGRRARDGACLFAPRPHRPARGLAGGAGHVHERPVADRFARDGPRHRADGRPRRCQPANE
jgi:hypothetical protein